MKRIGIIVVVFAVAVVGFLMMRAYRSAGRVSNPPNVDSHEVANHGASPPSADGDQRPTNGVDTPVVASALSAVSSFTTSRSRQRQQRDESLLSPDQDGWRSESFSEQALTKLKGIGASLNLPPTQRRGLIASFCSDVYHGTDFVPPGLVAAFDGAVVKVKRFSTANPLPLRRRGVDGFAESVETLVALFPAKSEIESHFKVVNVEIESNRRVSTRVVVEIGAGTPGLSRQITAIWSCDWEIEDPAHLRLVSIRTTEYEQAEVAVEANTWFVDHADRVIGHNAAYHQQFSLGHHEWLQRLERGLRFDTSVRNGLAIGDVNGDGLDDLFVCQPPGLPNRLFVHQPDGTADDRSQAAGVDWLDQTSAALFCDFDNDGDQDLVLGMHSGLQVMVNDSTGRFTLKTTLALDYDVQSLSSVDYDNDGRLDLFACVYRTASPASDANFLYRDATGGGLNRLFRNVVDGDYWRFDDVTQQVGLMDGANRYSLAASWEDYDNDGDQDLYVANDFGRNYLYQNNNGQFADVASSAGAMDIGSGMSVSWGDFDRDGWMDLYVGNMFSSAGQRVTTQTGFRANEDGETRGIYRRLAKGNTLLHNRMGDDVTMRRFADVGAKANVERGRWAWSSLFVDVNNDGWEDLFVTNGYMTTGDSGDL